MEKLTIKHIESLIEEKEFIYRGTFTICVLTMKNNFRIVGTAGCFNPEEYERSVGEEFAYEQAIEKLFEMEAFKLKTHE